MPYIVEQQRYKYKKEKKKQRFTNNSVIAIMEIDYF